MAAARTTFGVALVVLVLRSLARFQVPGLWAEDGTMFLPSALQWEWASIVTPTWGYFQVGPRLVAQLALLFPLQLFPAISLVVWLTLFSFVAAMFARQEYRALVPSDLARVLGGVAFCFAPGLHEMVGTLCNLHWVLSLGAWIVAMKPATERLKSWEVGWVAFAAFSGGEAIVLIPIFAFRAFEGARRNGRSWWRNADVVAIASLVVAVALNLSLRGSQPPGPAPDLAGMLSAFRYTVFTYLVYVPWLGADGASWLSLTANFNFFTLWAVLVLIAATVVLVLRRLRSDVHLLVGVSCWVFVVVLTWLVRPGSIEWWDRHQFVAGWLFNRYAFDLAPAALVFWLAVIRFERFDTQKVRLVLTLVLIAVAIPFGVTALPAFEPRQDWAANAARLDAAIRAGAGGNVSFPISPEDWTFSVELVAK